MEPIIFNFPDLTDFAAQFGPFGYLFGHGVAAMFFGILAWRNIGAAGKCHGGACSDSRQREKQQAALGNAYIARSCTSGVVGVVNVIIVIAMSAQLFNRAIDKVYPDYDAQTIQTTITITPEVSEELERLISVAGGVELACNKEK